LPASGQKLPEPLGFLPLPFREGGRGNRSLKIQQDFNGAIGFGVGHFHAALRLFNGQGVGSDAEHIHLAGGSQLDSVAHVGFGGHQAAGQLQLLGDKGIGLEGKGSLGEQGHQHDAAVAAGDLDGGVDQVDVIGGDEGGIDPLAAGQVQHFFGKIGVRQEEIVGGAHALAGSVQAVLADVGGDNIFSAAGAAHAGEHAADGAGAQDGDRLPGLQVGAAGDVDADGEGLDQAALGVGQGCGQGKDGIFWRGEVLAKGAGPDLGAQHLFRGAHIDIAAQAVFALAAGPLRVDHHAVARLEMGDGRSNGDHVSGDFVTEDDGGLAVGVGAVEGVHFGAANADDFGADEHIVGPLHCRHGGVDHGHMFFSG
jgi:hypothetical protein